MANLFPDPPVRTPFIDPDTKAISYGWIRWFQQVSGLFPRTVTSADAGSSQALPATPQGYVVIQVGTQQFKVPYYL